MDGTVLAGMIAWVLLALTPAAVFGLLLHGEGLARRCGAVTRRRRRPPADVPVVRPLQLVAADLRRLYPQVHDPVPGTRMAKQRGAVLAYDEHLATAATSLTVVTSLLQLPVGGVDREIERLRLEHALMGAGLVITPRAS